MTTEFDQQISKQEAAEQPQRFVVDFWPTGRCDMECPFCYGADVPTAFRIEVGNDGKGQKVYLYDTTEETRTVTGKSDARPEMTLPQMQEVVKKLKDIGVTTLNVAGGEPLLRPETPDIIKFAHNAGLEVYLSSNGTFFKRHYDQVKDNITILGLPLDGSTPDMNALMGRREYLYKNIQDILSYFGTNPPQHRVKVGTVISRINIADIEQIGLFLYRSPGQYQPDIWRLYQFEPIKKGARTRELYEIGYSEFEDVVSRLRIVFPEAQISARSNNDHMNAYFFVTPDGMLQIVDTKHRSVADLLNISTEDLRSIFANYRDTQIRASKNREWLSSQ